MAKREKVVTDRFDLQQFVRVSDGHALGQSASVGKEAS